MPSRLLRAVKAGAEMPTVAPCVPLPVASQLPRVLGTTVVLGETGPSSKVPSRCWGWAGQCLGTGCRPGLCVVLWVPRDAPSTGGCSGLGMLLVLGGCRMLGAPWEGSRLPDVATCAQMLPPMPLEHLRIRASTSTDVSKQLISSDRVTAVSLPCPFGDQGPVTRDPATQHPALWARHPTGTPPGLRVGTDPCNGAIESHRAPSAYVARARSQTRVLIPHIGFAGQDSINGSREPGRRQRLIRLQQAAVPPAGIDAACCRK